MVSNGHNKMSLFLCVEGRTSATASQLYVFQNNSEIVVFYYFSAKGDRGGSEGEDDLEELTDSAEESEENEEPTQPPVTTTHATTSTPSARKSGE